MSKIDKNCSYYKDAIGEKEYNNISIMAKIEDILHFYATSFISPLRYPDIHYDTSKAREGLELLKFIKEYCKHLQKENEKLKKQLEFSLLNDECKICGISEGLEDNENVENN